MQISHRLNALTPNYFLAVNKKIAEKRALGEEVIDFSVGDPDFATPTNVIDEISAKAGDPLNHRYPNITGLPELRQAVADWYKRRFGVILNPDNEILPLHGSKEGIGYLSLSCLNPGDVALVPDPGYPAYTAGTVLAGGEVFKMPLLSQNNYLPDLQAIPETVLKKAKIIWINYPNNPTGAVCDLKFFEDVAEFAQKHNLLVCHDAPYTEIAFEGNNPPSFLQAKGAKDVGVEFHSLSKSYNMAGWRIGMAVGNPEVIQLITKLKSNLDPGISQAIQYGAIEALNNAQTAPAKSSLVYQRRRDLIVEVLNDIGASAEMPKAGLYVWTKVPAGYTSAEFADDLLDKLGIVVTPGTVYGTYGEGYVRLSLTVSDPNLIKGLSRLAGWKNEKDKFKPKIRK
ncbi:MAG: LL-diaminopimelate aminotransferase [Dehalococcoidales bacterium]